MRTSISITRLWCCALALGCAGSPVDGGESSGSSSSNTTSSGADDGPSSTQPVSTSATEESGWSDAPETTAGSESGDPGAEADWQERIGGPGVVWYHDFRSDDEVDAFRWTGAYGSGNDPQAVGSPIAGNVRRITTDGITGGCLEIVRPAGADDGSVWWRPLSPIVGGTTTGNGRGAGNDDPGADGTIPAQPYAPTDGGDQVSSWGDRGYYGDAQYWPDSPGAFDGEEYWFQVRVKMDPNRIAGGNADVDVGKLFYFTRTDRSATDQEIVVFSGHPIDGENYFSMYRSVSPPLSDDPPGVAVHGDQPGTEYGDVGDGLCRYDDTDGRRANCWHWPAGEWVTVLWHVAPGTGGALGSGEAGNDTLVEVWVAREGETEYTRIWNQPGVDLPFDLQYGHNAIIASIYHNGIEMPVEFHHRYAQMIFSKELIPCPQI